MTSVHAAPAPEFQYASTRPAAQAD